MAVYQTTLKKKTQTDTTTMKHTMKHIQDTHNTHTQTLFKNMKRYQQVNGHN